MVQFMGDFEPFTPAPVVPGAVVELQMMLIGKGKTSNVTGGKSGEWSSANGGLIRGIYRVYRSISRHPEHLPALSQVSEGQVKGSQPC